MGEQTGRGVGASTGQVRLDLYLKWDVGIIWGWETVASNAFSESVFCLFVLLAESQPQWAGMEAGWAKLSAFPYH